MEAHDDDLRKFEADGGSPLPATNDQGYVEHDGARIWYTCYGSGSPVILLHGGFGHSGNWGYQVPALVRNDYRAILHYTLKRRDWWAGATAHALV